MSKDKELSFEPEIAEVEYSGGKAVIHFKPLEITDEKTIAALKDDYPEIQSGSSYEVGVPYPEGL